MRALEVWLAGRLVGTISEAIMLMRMERLCYADGAPLPDGVSNDGRENLNAACVLSH